MRKTWWLPAVLFLMSAPPGRAQAAAERPSFEVASVKPNLSGRNGINNKFTPDGIRWTNTPLQLLIQTAYGMRSDQVLACPGWAMSDTWDIEGKSLGPTPYAQRLLMLQVLLEDRFQLKVHSETREMPLYRLVVAKSGFKLHEAAPGTDRAGTTVGRGLIQGHRVPIANLAGFLTGELGRLVVDETGLKGDYDYKVEWVPDESQPNSGGVAPSSDAIGATIFTAVQEQLGLKLEATKGPIRVLLIDHVEKASAN